MILIEESVFGHEKLKKDVARCLLSEIGSKKTLVNSELVTLR
jgi:hypothetical protein